MSLGHWPHGHHPLFPLYISSQYKSWQLTSIILHGVWASSLNTTQIVVVVSHPSLASVSSCTAHFPACCYPHWLIAGSVSMLHASLYSSISTACFLPEHSTTKPAGICHQPYHTGVSTDVHSFIHIMGYEHRWMRGWYIVQHTDSW